MAKALILVALCCILYHQTKAGTVPPSTSTSANLFASDIFSLITKANPTTNVVFSPASIQTCLAFAFVGANGKTAEEMRKALYIGESDRNTVAQNYGALISSAFNNPKPEGPVLKMANRMIVNENIKVVPEFQEITKSSFNAQVENINFAKSQKAVSHINNWVEQATENKIKNLLQPGGVGADTSSVLVNAIYFKAEWKQPFGDDMTDKRTFHINGKQTTEVDMMYQENFFNYAELPEYNAQAFEMNFKNSDLSMLIILPNEIEGLTQLESNLQGVDLNDISCKMSKIEIEVFLPKFRIEFDISLNEPLKKMGLITMFSNAADFSHMFETSVPQKVSEVMHKAFLEVNEAGSEAAAATFSRITYLSAKLDIKTLRVDHPFVFVIKSKSTVYFAGHVTRF